MKLSEPDGRRRTQALIIEWRTLMIQTIRDLYEAGVDCGLESFQGSGVLAWVVDPRNRRVEKTFALPDLEAIAEWLLVEAARQRTTSESDTQSPHDLLAELANVRRKNARRVTADERRRRLDEQASRHHRSA